VSRAEKAERLLSLAGLALVTLHELA